MVPLASTQVPLDLYRLPGGLELRSSCHRGCGGSVTPAADSESASGATHCCTSHSAQHVCEPKTPQECCQTAPSALSSPAATAHGSSCGPALRPAVAAAQGHRPRMEDSHVIVQGLMLSGMQQQQQQQQPTTALLGVFDGHNGSHAAEFACSRIVSGIVSSQHFPADIRAALVEAFVQIDQAYYATLRGCPGESAGTTALTVLVWGNTLYVANAGDSRAVISRSGKAIDLTRDHKPHEPAERQRIESSGGYVCEQGLLNGELGVARAIGDYHLSDIKQPDTGAPCPLTAEPEVTTHQLQEGDEFMLLGCDGLWDVFPSQRAVEFARARLREHNDPQRCAQELVDEALRMHSSDNVTVICCCFGAERPKRRVYGSGRFSRSVSQKGLGALAAALQDQQQQGTAAAHNSSTATSDTVGASAGQGS